MKKKGGNKRKNRRKAKYAEQDDDDYERAVQLYGITPKNNLMDQKVKEQVVEVTKKDKKVQQDDDLDRECYLCHKSGHIYANCPEYNPNNPIEQASYSKLRNLAKKQEQLEIQSIINEDGDLHDDHDDIHHESLDYLTGIPTNNDLCLYAIPVVAPYITVKNYKLSMKLIPGNHKTKKGKMTKTMLDIFSKAKFLTVQQRQLIKQIDTNQIHQIIPSNSKIAMNLNQNKKKKKKENKHLKSCFFCFFFFFFRLTPRTSKNKQKKKKKKKKKKIKKK